MLHIKLRGITNAATGEQILCPLTPTRDLYRSKHFDLTHTPDLWVRLKVRKATKIMKRYNQVSHLPQDTTWESNKNTINITNKSSLSEQVTTRQP